jgi:hypothetical protein
MPNRARLDNRRRCKTFGFECAGLNYTATYSALPDGGIAEIFLNNHRSNSMADINARDAAVVFSIGRQYGVPLEIMRAALMRDTDGKASGPLGTAIDLICDGEK